MKTKIDYNRNTNDVSISYVDDKGNGIILLRGKFGGCDFLKSEEVNKRVEVLDEMVALWNDFKGN